MDGELVAYVAADINGRGLRDASARIVFAVDGDTEHTVDTIALPWQAEQDRISFELSGYGYLVGPWDLLALDGYVLKAELRLTRAMPLEQHAGCGGDSVCVQNRLENRDELALALIQKYLCRRCGQVWAPDVNGAQR